MISSNSSGRLQNFKRPTKSASIVTGKSSKHFQTMALQNLNLDTFELEEIRFPI